MSYCCAPRTLSCIFAFVYVCIYEQPHTTFPCTHTSYHSGDRVFQTVQINKTTDKNLSENGTSVRQLGFLNDVPEGLSGGVYVNEDGEAVGTLSHRSDEDKMTYAICLCSKAATDFFCKIPECKIPDTGAGPQRVLEEDLNVMKEWDKAVKSKIMNSQIHISPSLPGGEYHGTLNKHV